MNLDEKVCKSDDFRFQSRRTIVTKETQQILSSLYASMRTILSKNGQNGAKIDENRKKLGRYPTLPPNYGSHDFFLIQELG